MGEEFVVCCWKPIRTAIHLSFGLALTISMPSQGQAVAQFEYDAVGRLTRVKDGVDSASGYQYDAAGNRVRVTSVSQFPQSWNATSPAIGHIIGREEAGGWSARVENPFGHMIFGPYTNSAATGTRVAAFRMLVDNNDANDSAVVDLDVWNATTGS